VNLQVKILFSLYIHFFKSILLAILKKYYLKIIIVYKNKIIYIYFKLDSISKIIIKILTIFSNILFIY